MNEPPGYRHPPDTKIRKKVLSKTTVAGLNGEIDYSTWSDEELFCGRTRDKRGGWTGRPPILAPMKLVAEIAKRQNERGTAAMWSAVGNACEWLADVAAGRAEPDDARLRAVVILLNRTLGPAPTSITITSEDARTPYEQAGVRKAIVIRDAIEARLADATDSTAADEPPEPEPPTRAERRKAASRSRQAPVRPSTPS